MKVSVVMPIRNEAMFLPYALRSLEHALVDEVVLFLDRCSDQSYRIAEAFSHNHRVPGVRVRLVANFTEPSWRHPLAQAFERAFEYATGDILYVSAGDLVLDPSIFTRAWVDAGYDVASFRYLQLNMGHNGPRVAYLNLLNRLPFIYTCRYGKWSGVFGMRRTVWETLHFRDVRSPDLDLFQRAYQHGFTHHFYPSGTVHLRAGVTAEKQVDQAKHRAETGVPVWKVLAHSVFELKPRVAATYLKERLA